MLVAAIFVALAIDPMTPATPQICNGMQVEVDGVQFEAATGGASVAVSTTLKPGACVDVPQVAPGDYTLHFTERGPNGEAAMCARRVAVKPGDTIRISPDDGSSCVM